MVLILDPSRNSVEQFSISGGGKARNLALSSSLGIPVPEFICISSEALERFSPASEVESRIDEGEASIEALFCRSPLPPELEMELAASMAAKGWNDSWLAVRSSGLEEDGAEHSFAGQFSSFLFQKGLSDVSTAIKKCWASAYSDRALSYRRQKGLSTRGLRMGVVIQKMVSCEKAGVGFSRNPIRPLDRDHALVSSVWGLGEGLVSGELDADHFEVVRNGLVVARSEIADKTHALRHAPAGGLTRVELDPSLRSSPSLTPEEASRVASLCVELERRIGSPQDCEWGFEGDRLYCLQTRPITTLPPEAFYDSSINGATPTLWDNSNIIESYNGVTSPLTFSFASSAYRQVYVQFCEVMGVPPELIREREPMFRNMLGLVRGRIYYNLVNWYRLVLMLPGAGTNKAFMETMMGVRQQLKPELLSVFDTVKEPQHYPLPSRILLFWKTFRRWRGIDSIISTFQSEFDAIYREARATEFRKLSFQEHLALYQLYDARLLRRWHAPIINDYLCMVFFGLLKRLTEKWLGSDAGSLQNDLLCGQGDLESTEPTKMLMRIAAWIDADPANAELRSWWLARPSNDIASALLGPGTPHPEATRRFREFLDHYGFRCINELKLESPDLHDDPGFAIEAISAYVRRKSYSIDEMEIREKAIRERAESEVRNRLSGPRLRIFFWVLSEARKAVRNRENLRFDRTKIFGVVRHLFRAMGEKLKLMGQLDHEADVFYLTTDELLGWGEGRSCTLDLAPIARARKKEFADFEATPPPPDRFITVGATGYSNRYIQALLDSDLLRSEAPASTDPNVLLGTPCCPGIVEGVVRVVKQASDAQGLDGEILVTERTDPGWVPLYPSCSGLLIERGSLLSHSAVVARELGLPTIVGVSGGLVKKLKTGMRVRVDAGRGEIRILT